MKTKLGIKGLGILIVLFYGIFVSSCTKEEPLKAPESENYTLKSAADPQPDDMVCDLIAGQTINVGQVVYSHVGNNLLVEYITTGGWILSEVHFYVGNMEDFKGTCMNKKAIQIGKFPYSATDLNDPTHSFTFQLAGITPDADGFMVVAHAVVKKVNEDGTIQEETAFANCTYKPLIVIKSIYSGGDGTWQDSYATSMGTLVNPTTELWCKNVGYNIYNKGDSYSLINFNGVIRGNASVYDDGISLIVTITPLDGYTWDKSYLFVGNMGQLQSAFEADGSCPEYWTTPFISSYITSGISHVFTVPVPTTKNFSFATLSADRWGWYSYYNF